MKGTKQMNQIEKSKETGLSMPMKWFFISFSNLPLESIDETRGVVKITGAFQINASNDKIAVAKGAMKGLIPEDVTAIRTSDMPNAHEALTPCKVYTTDELIELNVKRSDVVAEPCIGELLAKLFGGLSEMEPDQK